MTDTFSICWSFGQYNNNNNNNNMSLKATDTESDGEYGEIKDIFDHVPTPRISANCQRIHYELSSEYDWFSGIRVFVSKKKTESTRFNPFLNIKTRRNTSSAEFKIKKHNKRGFKYCRQWLRWQKLIPAKSLLNKCDIIFTNY